MQKKQALKFWVDGGDIKKIPKQFFKDKSFMIKMIKIQGSMLQYAHKSLKKNKSLVLVAIKDMGSNLEFADNS